MEFLEKIINKGGILWGVKIVVMKILKMQNIVINVDNQRVYGC